MKTRRALFSMALTAWLLALGMSTVALYAADPGLPPRPAVPPPAPAAQDTKLVGGWIELRVQGASSQWTIVQWQDSLGGWHDVGSWQGLFDAVANGVGQKTWWLEKEQFGVGPYRWLIYDKPGGQLLAQSKEFMMPKQNRQMVSMEVVLPQP